MPPVPPNPFYAQQPTNVNSLEIVSGNVGIGTSSPTEKLTVNGNVTVFGDIYSSGQKVLTEANFDGYATTGYVTGVSGSLQTQISTLTSQTGSYVTGLVVRPSDTGQFYPRTNPSGYTTSEEVASALSGKSNTGHFHTMSDIIDLKSGVGLTTRVFLTGPQTADRGQIIVPFTPFNLASNTNYKIEMHLPVTSSNGGITSGSFSGTASVAFKTYQSSNNITSAAEQGVPGIRSTNLISAAGTSQAHVWGVVRTSSTGTFLLNFGCDNSSPVGATASVRAGAYLEITEIS